MKNDTLHNQLKNALILQINKCTINEKFPSERILANKHQVCRATINKVIVELQHEGYLVRHQGKGTFVSPKHKIMLNGAEESTTQGNVIMVYPDFYSHLIWERVHYAEMAALKNNLNLVNIKMQKETNYDSLMKIFQHNPNLKGIIFSSSEKLPTTFLHDLEKLGVPVVLLGSITNISRYQNIYEVRIDYFKSGYIRTNFLLEKGHRKIGLVVNEPSSEAGGEHLKGIKQALYDHELRFKDLIISNKKMKIGEEPMQVGYAQTKKLLAKHQVTALIFETIRGAFGGLRALYELGLNCPEDISIITSQTCFGLEEMSCPALTNVNYSTEIMINKGIEIILNKGSEIKNHIINTEIHERESVKQIN